MSRRADSVVTHHLNPFRSGVARFNAVLADRLGVPLLPLFSDGVLDRERPLFSFKPAEVPGAQATRLAAIFDRIERYHLFLHEWSDLPIERRMVAGAAQVWCANQEVLAAVQPLNDRSAVLWAPALVSDQRTFRDAEISVFSFGMAHKIRADMFARLHGMLERSGRSYAVYLSNANHEAANAPDTEAVYEEMHALLGDSLYFLGNLSDVAIHNYLLEATFFAAFFRRGARANNTTVISAMERGAVVITNLDENSPPWLTHMDTVVDIEQCDELPSDPLALRGISARAVETARSLTWDQLIEAIEAP